MHGTIFKYLTVGGGFDAFWSASRWGIWPSKFPTYRGIWPKIFKKVKCPEGGGEGIRDIGLDWYIIAFLEEPHPNSEVSIIGKKITVILCCKWHFLIFILYSSQYLYYYIVVRYIENRLRPSLSFFLSPSSKTRDTRKLPRTWLKARLNAYARVHSPH